jgi:hypothetical protein
MTKQIFDAKLTKDEYFLNLSQSRMIDLFAASVKLRERMNMIIKLFKCLNTMSESISLDKLFSKQNSFSRYDLTVVNRKSVRSLRNLIIIISSWMLRNLNEFCQDSNLSVLSSRNIKTKKFSDRSWIMMIVDSFRVFKASFIYRDALNSRTSFMIFRIAINRWVMIDEDAFIFVILEYASKTSSVDTNSLRSTKSFNILNFIWSAESRSISNIFAVIISYTQRSESW